MLGKLSSLLLAAAVLCFSYQAEARMRHAPRERNIFSLGLAGVATPQPNTLSVAAPLANLSNRDVADVKIDRVLLARAPVQAALPMTVGAIRARSSTIVEAELNSQSLVSGHSYPLLMRGTYRERGGRYDEHATRRFIVYTSVIVPPPSEGSGQVGSIQLPPHQVSGGKYPHRPPLMDKDVNSGAPPVPT